MARFEKHGRDSRVSVEVYLAEHPANAGQKSGAPQERVLGELQLAQRIKPLFRLNSTRAVEVHL